MGLKDDILKSNSKKEIQILLEIGSKFENPSIKTKRSWINTSRRRIIELDKIKNINKKPKEKKFKGKK